MIRFARQSDAEAVAEIFAPVVESTAISFMTEPVTPEQMAAKICEVTEALPWLVFEDSGEVLGYAYASKHRALGAYRWSVETSIYVSPRAHRKGVASALYRALIAILKKQGYYNAYAGITLPNEASISFHEAFGFRKFCEFEKVGHKLGRWHDVGWWVLPIQGEYHDTPNEPRPIAEIDLAKLL